MPIVNVAVTSSMDTYPSIDANVPINTILLQLRDRYIFKQAKNYKYGHFVKIFINDKYRPTYHF